MILIVTHKEDYTADFVIEKLNNRNIAYFRFNCEDLLANKISFKQGIGQEQIVINGIDNFHSLWYRRTKIPEVNSANEYEKMYLANEADTFMRNLLALLPVKWLSNPDAIERAENKLLQLALAKVMGFNVPRTLVTTDVKELRNFYANNSGTIIKPIARGRIEAPGENSKIIFTSLLTDEALSDIDDSGLVPSIFQECIEKEYEIRVTVVGEIIFAASVASQSLENSSLDWRKEKIKFERYELPYDLQAMCLKLIKELGINFGAFDFIKAKDGKYYFVEVNPNGQWVWIEQDTGMGIADAIINFLQ